VTDMLTLVDEAQLAAASAGFETASASAVLRWARDTFGSGLALASSFQDCVLVDVAVRQFPEVEVIFLDTGFHFPETLDYVESVRERYDLNLTVLRSDLGPEEWPCGTDRCCERRKVTPLGEALAQRDAWMTGLRRMEASTRTDAPIVGWDESRGLVQVNPLATWTDQDVAGYVTDHNLPVHPLTSQGYLSIGCAPTTRAVLPGEDPRAGRWAGTDKVECGIHL
jgi:phosphoadenosine phosphosulfate reductase